MAEVQIRRAFTDRAMICMYVSLGSTFSQSTWAQGILKSSRPLPGPRRILRVELLNVYIGLNTPRGSGIPGTFCGIIAAGLPFQTELGKRFGLDQLSYPTRIFAYTLWIPTYRFINQTLQDRSTEFAQLSAIRYPVFFFKSIAPRFLSMISL